MPAFSLSPRACALRLALASGAALVLWTPALAQQAPRSLVAPSDLVPVQAETDLVQLFADWMKRHPVGTTVPPSQAQVLSADDLPSGLPALAQGRRYAVFDGMIVEIDAAYKLIRLVRRAPTEAPAAAPAPAPTAEAPAPTADAPAAGANATADANATANVTVNIIDEDDRDDEEDDRDDEDRKDRDDDSRVLSIAEAQARGIRIPRGHQPEAGTCRLWTPGTPPGRQPRGGADCDMKAKDIPEGAFLIRG